MTDTPDPDVTPGPRPRPEELAYDLESALGGIVAIRARVPDNALSAATLGTERSGNGVVIDRAGLVVTIGYLVSDAEAVWVVTSDHRLVPAYVAGYDQATGFGVVRTLGDLDAPAFELGESAAVRTGDQVVVAGWGGIEQTVRASVIAKREFAGYWEYVLDEAIFTSPPHPSWGGAALIGECGELLGIGSLLVQHKVASGDTEGANLFVPIDLLKPILDDLVSQGRPMTPARPWLGMLVQEVGDDFVVARVYPRCPAEVAGMRVGDLIVEVNGRPFDGLAGLFRSIWALGNAGTPVPLTLEREGERIEVTARSIDRNAAVGATRAGTVH